MPVGKRKRIAITPADEKKIVGALDKWAATGDFIALRTRAFVFLLWDGAVRTKAAHSLNAEEVVTDPDTLRIVKEVVQRPCEGNRFRELHFFLSERARKALADYLKVVRRDGWLPDSRLEGPLFLSSYNRGTGKRSGRRTAIDSWRTFLREHANVSVDYQLDDVVYTGRLAFLQAAGGDSGLLSQHAGISDTWASAAYRDQKKSSPKNIMAKLHKKR